MAFLDDLKTARDRVAQIERDLAAAKATVSALEAELVRGGPDVSQFQGDVDWTKVATVSDVVFPRVSDGDQNDTAYSAARISAIRSAGLSFPPYYYARIASDANGQRTARTEAAMAYYFTSRYGWGKPGDLPLVYDFEQSQGETTTFQGQTLNKAALHLSGWINSYNDLTGHLPIIYVNNSTAGKIVGVMTDAQKTLLAKCPLWIAHWGVTTPTIPLPWTQAYFHQFTDKQVYPGVTNPCDGNTVLVSRTQLDSIRIK